MYVSPCFYVSFLCLHRKKEERRGGGKEGGGLNRWLLVQFAV